VVPEFPEDLVSEFPEPAAVELQLRNGTRFRIGTDEPAALVDALRKAGVSA